MRGGARQHERDTARRTAIPITVRQLEEIIRIAEALAKVSLSPFALASHVDEALRLFRVSIYIYIQPGILFHEHDMITHQLVDLLPLYNGMACRTKGNGKVVYFYL